MSYTSLYFMTPNRGVYTLYMLNNIHEINYVLLLNKQKKAGIPRKQFFPPLLVEIIKKYTGQQKKNTSWNLDLSKFPTAS